MKATDPQPQQKSEGDTSDVRPVAGRPVIADVYAAPKTGGGAEFSLKWRFEGETQDRDLPIDIPPKGSGQLGTTIHFHLHDETHRGFAFDPVDPIWVSRVECPERWSQDREIPEADIVRHRKLLTIHDRNDEKCDLHFALNFEDNGGEREPYDPMIRNGGTI